MGLVKADIELVNCSDVSFLEAGIIDETKVRRITVTALVDTGSVMLAINENVKTQLGLKVKDVRPSRLADGSLVELEVVGPVEVRFNNRFSTTNALVLPGNEEVLLSAIPIEEMDVLIHPASQQLIVNPEHPNKPQMVLK